jgi:nitrogen-specific signal transduction histidine kinase
MLVSRPVLAEWVLGAMSSGIVAVDAHGAIAAINEEARRILGAPAGELRAALGRDCREALAAQPGVVRLLLETLRGRAALSRAELTLEHASQARHGTIGFTLTPLHDAQERLRGAAMVFRDLTPFERSGEQDRLRDRLTALGQMAAGMAHEIRNPLAGMEVIVGLLKRQLEDRPEAQELVADLTGELRKLADTVTASLDFVRPLSLCCEPVDAVALIEEALAIALSRVPFSGEIERRYDGRLPELVADADQLRAVLTNLIVNALEAMQGLDAASPRRLLLGLRSHVADRVGRAVRVAADGSTSGFFEGPSREVLIRVSDSGPGVPEDLRERIFYPFFTTKEGGSGVGLAIAQKIVAAHGGAIELQVGAQGGSTFLIRLPDADGTR